MDFVVLTIFPDMCRPFWEHGIVRRAVEGGQITAEAVDIRDFAHDRHKTTDDRPYGGGCGMVMKPEPLVESLRSVKDRFPKARTVMLTPQGRPFDQDIAASFALEKGLVLVCGRYEGIDERFCRLVDDEVSLGDFVLTGGELGAMVIIDAVTRLLPGVLGGRIRRHMTPLQTVCWSMRILHGRMLSKEKRFPKYCFRAITGKLKSGAMKAP